EQVEVPAAVLRLEHVERVRVLAVGGHRGDALLRALEAGVALRLEHLLAVAGEQVEVELAVLAGEGLELAGLEAVFLAVGGEVVVGGSLIRGRAGAAGDGGEQGEAGDLGLHCRVSLLPAPLRNRRAACRTTSNRVFALALVFNLLNSSIDIEPDV